jgi:hypothetical protein
MKSAGNAFELVQPTDSRFIEGALKTTFNEVMETYFGTVTFVEIESEALQNFIIYKLVNGTMDVDKKNAIIDIFKGSEYNERDKKLKLRNNKVPTKPEVDAAIKKYSSPTSMSSSPPSSMPVKKSFNLYSFLLNFAICAVFLYFFITTMGALQPL